MTQCITSITPTLCKLMNVSPPATANAAEALDLTGALESPAGFEKIEKCLVFAPDAIGAFLWEKYPDEFTAVTRHAPIRVPLRSMFPPKTPVCFASMFTGAGPQVHGISRYERPVLTCETLFDALIAAGKRVAIAAVAGSSIDTIFKNRPMDYFSEDYDKQVLKRTLELIESDRHDFILSYVQEYDDTLHKATPESPECIEAMKRHIGAFDLMAKTMSESWRRYDRAVVFAPDHGAHIDPATGRGDHGEDIPEDMNIHHCFGLYKGM